MQYDGGIANCTVELITVHRDGPKMETWSNFVSGRHIAPLRRVGKFRYDSFEHSVFPVKAFAYSGAHSVNRVFGDGFCVREGQARPENLVERSFRSQREAQRNGNVRVHSGNWHVHERKTADVIASCDTAHDEDCDIFDDTYLSVAQTDSMFVEPTDLTDFCQAVIRTVRTGMFRMDA